jgi:excisionase family DNA binding protein
VEDRYGRRRQRKIVRPQTPVVMLSIQEIARRYRFHENTVRRWVSQDGLKYIRYGPGGKIYIAEKDVEEFIHKFYDY